MKSSFLYALALMAAPLAIAEPADDVKAAAKKLADAENYSWSTKTAVPDTGGRFQPPSVEGKANKAGLAHIVTTMGDRTTESVVKGGKSATKSDAGWQTPEEARAAREAARGADGQGGQGGQGRGQGGRRGGFFGRSLENFKAPAQQVEALVGQTTGLKVEGDAITGALTEEAVRTQLMGSFGGGRRGNGGEAPAPTNTSGSVKFWVKDGNLAKFEVHVQGTFSFNGNDRTIDRTTTTEIKDIGTTKLDVPEEATKKLEGGSAPAEEKKAA
jgi:hypothetical protein